MNRAGGAEQRAGLSELTWWGHAAVQFRIGGVRIMTDPVLTDRIGPLRRAGSAAIDPGALDRPDLVLISHLHLDHLHAPSLAALGEDLHIVLPAGGRRLLDGVPVGRVSEVRPGDRVDVGPVSIEVHPAEHSAHRWPFGRLVGPALGFVVRVTAEADTGAGVDPAGPVTPAVRSVYFAGDTDLFAGMAHLGPIDLAAIPIWGWGPRLGPGHLDPERAARAVEIIDPGVVVPIHWGTYHPARVRTGPPTWLNRPIEDFVRQLGRNGSLDRLRRLPIGTPHRPPSDRT